MKLLLRSCLIGITVFILYLFVYCSSENEIADCIKSQIEGRKYRKSRETLFSVAYGEAAVEVLNVFTHHEMKEIEALASCMRLHQPQTLNDDRDNHRHDLTIAVLQTHLPHIVSHLLEALDEGFRKARWNKMLLSNGILSNISYHSLTGTDPIEKFLEEVKVKQKKVEQEKAVFVIGAVGSSASTKFDWSDHYQKLREIIVEGGLNSFNIIALLSDRSQFTGAEIVIDYKPKKPALLQEGRVDDYEEDLIPEIEPNYEKPEVDKITIERGSILIIHPTFAYGITPVLHGKRSALTLQLSTIP